MRIASSILATLVVAMLHSSSHVALAQRRPANKIGGLLQHRRHLSGEPPVPELEEEDDETATQLPEIPEADFEIPETDDEVPEEVGEGEDEMPEEEVVDESVPDAGDGDEEPTQLPEVPETGGDGEPPMNDMCEAAMALAVGDVVMGSTADATEEDLENCVDFVGGNSSGVWYMLTGTGGGMEVEVNATFDVEFAIFAGDCDSLMCLDGTAGEVSPYTYGDAKGATIEGEIYYVYVTGWEGARGDFEISVNEGDIPDNSECSAAPMLEVGGSVEGSTDFARVPQDVPPCSIDELFSNITSSTVWYSLMGTGEIVQLSVFADFDSKVSIYSGDSCDSLTCDNTNDDSPILGPRSVIAEPLVEGQMYYINVHGFGRESGAFTLESTTLEPAANDDCDTAIPLEAGVSISSDTLAASADEGLPFCGLGSNASSPGIWYSIEGTGNTMQIRLNDTLKLHFSVYTGECGDLTCADNRFLGFFPLTWDTVEGEVYKVFVYGRERALSDTFDIIVEEVERPGNDMCEAAISLELNQIYEGTTKASSSDEGLEFCGDVEEGFGGVWYTFTGNGVKELIGVSAGGIDMLDIFDTQVTLYSGSSCGELTCVTGNDQGASYEEYENSILLETVEGETYYVYVHGFGADRGDFTIALLGVTLPENDACDTAIVLELGDTIQGSTVFADQSDDLDFGECGTSKSGNSSAPGLWYAVEGGGFPVQASVMAEYDMQLTVMSGDGCESLACLDGTEGNENDFFSGQVIFDAEEGAMYYIYVHGFAGQTGDFELFYETAIA